MTRGSISTYTVSHGCNNVIDSCALLWCLFRNHTGIYDSLLVCTCVIKGQSVPCHMMTGSPFYMLVHYLAWCLCTTVKMTQEALSMQYIETGLSWFFFFFFQAKFIRAHWYGAVLYAKSSVLVSCQKCAYTHCTNHVGMGSVSVTLLIMG